MVFPHFYPTKIQACHIWGTDPFIVIYCLVLCSSGVELGKIPNQKKKALKDYSLSACELTLRM